MRASLAALVAAVLALAVGAAPVRAAIPTPPHLQVTAADLYDPATGQDLDLLNAEARLPIASTTKLMTALITLQHVHKLGTVFTQTDWRAPAADSQIGLAPGERMSVHDLLLALMLPSADDAAIDLAYNVGGGSIAQFVGMMNAEAVKLGLAHTHYSNPVGLDQAGNYSSAADLTRLAAYDMQFSPYFRRIVGLPRAVLRTGNHVRYVVNRDDLVGKVPWITGVKTGHTSGAGYVLVSSGTFRGMTLIGAVLGTSSEAARDANALALMRWGFENYRQADPVTAGAVIARPTINGGTSRATVIAGGSFARAVLKSDRITLTNSLPRNLNGPLARHAVVGHETVRINGRPVRRIPLLLARAIPGLSPLTQASRFARRPITLVVLVLAIGVAATLLAARRRRPTPAV